MAEEDNGNGKVKQAITEYQLAELGEKIDGQIAEFRELRKEVSSAITVQATLCERVNAHDRDITALKAESRGWSILNTVGTAAVALYMAIIGNRP